MKKVEDEVKGMLMLGEEVLLIAEQERMVPGGSLFSPNKVYVTNRRIIFRNPWLLGLKANLVDIDYRDISNVRLKRGIFSTEIYLKSRFLSDEVMLPAVDKSTALKLNELIRKGVRGELPGQVISEEATKPVRETSPIEQLEKLNELRKTGAITEDEFQQLKARLLGVTPTPPSPPQPESCPFCGASSPIGSKFCPVCGKKIRGLQEPLSA